MIAWRDPIVRRLLTVVILSTLLSCAEVPAAAPKQTKPRRMYYEFPKGVIQCQQGDFIARKSGNGAWKVFLVEDMFFLSRLIPINARDSVVLAEQIDFMDSAKPPKWKEIHLLISEFEKEYRSSEEAFEAIKSGTLGDSTRGLCRSINEFPKVNSRIYRKPS